MFMHDLNSDKTKVMLLIHPMLSSASGLKECITDNMGDDFRYLMPDLSGHGDAVKSTYVNAKQEAKGENKGMGQGGLLLIMGWK